jgi:hypothetical protein
MLLYLEYSLIDVDFTMEVDTVVAKEDMVKPIIIIVIVISVCLVIVLAILSIIFLVR